MRKLPMRAVREFAPSSNGMLTVKCNWSLASVFVQMCVGYCLPWRQSGVVRQGCSGAEVRRSQLGQEGLE